MHWRSTAKFILAYHKCETGTQTQCEIRTAAGILLASKVYLLEEKKCQCKIKPCKWTENNQSAQDLRTALRISGCLCAVLYVFSQKCIFSGVRSCSLIWIIRNVFSFIDNLKSIEFRLWQVWPCFSFYFLSRIMQFNKAWSKTSYPLIQHRIM